MAFIEEFKAFISRGNVFELAAGIMIGATFNNMLNSLVGDIIMPIVGWLTAGIDFSNYFIALNGKHYDSLRSAKDAGAPVVAYGIFINYVIKFLISSAVIFLVIKQVNRLHYSLAPQDSRNLKKDGT
ncbi:large conductance mechanosensitive channel protein MscL [Candidatus Jidaibacter acanthamoebae]|nr:large conductance mechanosensitive channel protein MscL [Candidatus Jidaibacter acanthamoeba]